MCLLTEVRDLNNIAQYCIIFNYDKCGIMIDAMQVRKRGTPQNPMLMKMVMVSVRIGTAAYFAGQKADNMLGRYGHWLKHLFEITRGGTFALRVVLKSKNSKRLIGLGGQYIVLHAENPNFIEKYSHTLAGADPEVLQWMLDFCRNEHAQMVTYFGDLMQATEYDLAKLPIRGPAKKLLTLRARQATLHNRIDLFKPEARDVLVAPGSEALRQDVQNLYQRIIAAMRDDVWLDIIGPENVIITTDGTEPHIRIIDIEPYVPEYLDILNPMNGKTYRQVFMERLRDIEQLTGLSSQTK